MTKKIVLAVGIVAALLVGLNTRQAYGGHDNSACISEEAASQNLLKNYGEIPLFEGAIAVDEPTRVIIYANPANTTWTAVIIDIQGCAVIASSGVFWSLGKEVVKEEEGEHS